MKNYQTTTRRARAGGVARKKAGSGVDAEIVPPSTVEVELDALAEEKREGLLALAVGTGLRVMHALMADEVSAVVGPKGKCNPERTARRHGTDGGEVTLGGRRIGVRKPRVRTADGSAEVSVDTYELFSSTELLGRLAMERMLAKLSARRYRAGLEPVGSKVSAHARGISRSAVSRRFVHSTETALAELLAADLQGMDLVAIMIDGVHFGGHLCVVAMGIDEGGVKHPLALEEGDTENATLVKDLLAGLRERGLDTTRAVLRVLAGAKALHAGVRAVFDEPVIQRCQLHEIRNVQDKLPKVMGATVAKEMRAAYHEPDALVAEAALEHLARGLAHSHPGAAASLREGLAETITVARLGISPTLARTLRSTDAVESMIEICRDYSRT